MAALTTEKKTQEALALEAKQDSSEPAQTSDTPVETNDEQASRISAAIARGRSALEEVRAKVGEYDKQYKASETASAYLGGPIQKAQAAFDDLAATASSLKDKTVEIPTKALSRTLTTANAALQQITDLAGKYDEKLGVTSKVRTAVSVPQEKCRTALAEISNLAASVSAAANAQLQDVNHGICSRAASIASSSASLVFSTAAALDDRLDIESKATRASTAVAGKAQQLEERYNVKENVGSLATGGLERARGLDSRVTGGRVTPLVLAAFETGLTMAVQGVSFVQCGYESAKQQRRATDDLQSKPPSNVTEEGPSTTTEAPVKESTSEAK